MNLHILGRNIIYIRLEVYVYLTYSSNQQVYILIYFKSPVNRRHFLGGPVGNLNSSVAENVLSRLLVDLVGLHLDVHERLGALKH